jgi:hypothetical protein
MALCYFVLLSLTQKRRVLLRRNNSPSAMAGYAKNMRSASLSVAAISNFPPSLMTVITPPKLTDDVRGQLTLRTAPRRPHRCS